MHSALEGGRRLFLSLLFLLLFFGRGLGAHKTQAALPLVSCVVVLGLVVRRLLANKLACGLLVFVFAACVLFLLSYCCGSCYCSGCSFVVD